MKKRSLILLLLFLIPLLFLSSNGLSKDQINTFDRTFVNPYNKTLDKTATVLDFTLLFSPILTTLGGKSDLITLGVMYAETVFSSWAIKELLKENIYRARPYMYYDNPPQEEESKWNKSFPSGHTTLAFASASFTSYVFGKYYPDSKWRIPVSLSLYTLATTTALLRVSSGNHFLTDVLAGALIGTLCGLTIPMLHTLNNKASVSLTPFALLFSVGW